MLNIVFIGVRLGSILCGPFYVYEIAISNKKFMGVKKRKDAWEKEVVGVLPLNVALPIFIIEGFAFNTNANECRLTSAMVDFSLVNEVKVKEEKSIHIKLEALLSIFCLTVITLHEH